MDTIVNFFQTLEEFIQTLPIFWSFIFGVLIIILESIIPALPLGLFIAFNVLVFGNITGFLISWISTCLGCFISFTLVRKGFRKFFDKKIEKTKNVKVLMKKINHIDFTLLTLIIALPFTPAFLINISAGLSKISKKKFIMAILIGKLSIVYFWGYIGKTFIESITDINVLIKLLFMLIGAFLFSKIILKKCKFDVGE